MMKSLGRFLGIGLAFLPAVEAGAYKAYVSNEKGNTVSVIDTTTWKLVDTIKVGQRPRGIALTRIKNTFWSRSATTTPSR